ncbi:hypothetical protein TSMEX_000345 [Taenia solium]|eukprot:TsM_000485500 transcript=TsM_000485500 gene=TsM_000485500
MARKGDSHHLEKYEGNTEDEDEDEAASPLPLSLLPLPSPSRASHPKVQIFLRVRSCKIRTLPADQFWVRLNKK